MIKSTSVTVSRPRATAEQDAAARPNMLFIPGGTFRMGSNKHYPEEAPAHQVTVSGFWIDRTPVTNRQFKEFVRATGHVTFAEVSPDPRHYPGALPDMLYAGTLVFTPPRHPVDLKNFGEWWRYLRDANWRHPYGPKSNINALDNHPVVHCRAKRARVQQPLQQTIHPMRHLMQHPIQRWRAAQSRRRRSRR